MSATSFQSSAPSPLPRLVSIKEVAEWLGVSRQAVYNAVARGALPKPIKLGSNCVRFVETELLNYLRERGARS